MSPACPATAPVSPLSPHIPPTPAGHCTTTSPLPSYFSSPHHRAPDCPLIPTYLSSIRLLSGKPAPATPGLFLVCQLPSDAQRAKHPARHHPHSPGRKGRGIKQNTALSVITEHGKDLIITQCYRRSKEKNPTTKAKSITLSTSQTCWVCLQELKITQTTNSSAKFCIKKATKKACFLWKLNKPCYFKFPLHQNPTH